MNILTYHRISHFTIFCAPLCVFLILEIHSNSRAWCWYRYYQEICLHSGWRYTTRVQNLHFSSNISNLELLQGDLFIISDLDSHLFYSSPSETQLIPTRSISTFSVIPPTSWNNGCLKFDILEFELPIFEKNYKAQNPFFSPCDRFLVSGSCVCFYPSDPELNFGPCVLLLS